MKKTIFSLAVISSLSLQAGDFYAGGDIDFGTGTHELSIDGTTVAESNTLSSSSFGIHGGYMLTDKGSIEVSLAAVDLDGDSVTRLGVDYLHRFDAISNFTPYVAVGLSANSLSNSNVETGIGGRLRAGATYALTPKIDVGAELNYNYIGWETATDYLGRDWSLSSSYYGIGVNANYKF